MKGARRAREPKLVGRKEAAEIVGVSSDNLLRMAGLPEQYDRVAATPLWRRSDVEEYVDRRSDA